MPGRFAEIDDVLYGAASSGDRAVRAERRQHLAGLG